MAPSEELDLDLIAALIDGRLSGAERQRAIKHVNESEAALEIYADALRVLPDIPVPDAKVIPLPQPKPRPGFSWRTMGSVAAAAVLLIAVVPTFMARRDNAALDAQSSQITMALARRPDLSQRLGGDWDTRTWSVTRGESAQVDSTLAFRLGVRAVDLNVAFATGDTARAARLTGEIIEALGQVRLSDLAKAEYTELRTQLSQPRPGTDASAIGARAERTLDELLDSFWFRFGRWTAGGELAARSETTEFFADPRTARFLNVAAKRDGLDRADAEILGQIAGLAGNNVNGEAMNTLRQLFGTLIRRHGG